MHARLTNLRISCSIPPRSLFPLPRQLSHLSSAGGIKRKSVSTLDCQFTILYEQSNINLLHGNTKRGFCFFLANFIWFQKKSFIIVHSHISQCRKLKSGARVIPLVCFIAVNCFVQIQSKTLKFLKKSSIFLTVFLKPISNPVFN